MSESPNKIPRALTHQKSLRSQKKKLCTMAKRNIGQKSNFICSQVDSFTPEKGAIHTASPNQSYKKCRIVPPSDVTANPISCQSPIDLSFIIPPKTVLLNSIFERGEKYAQNLDNERLFCYNKRRKKNRRHTL